MDETADRLLTFVDELSARFGVDASDESVADCPHPAAEPVPTLEDRDPAPPELPRGDESGESGADDEHIHGALKLSFEEMDELLEVVKSRWGYDTFRPLQREAMTAALEKRDSLVVLPTGGGKSICYQAPALLRDGVTVVVSPLISLMKDQVDRLLHHGIPAA